MTMSKEKHIDQIVFEDMYCGVHYWIKQYGLYTEDGQHDYRWYCCYVEVPKKKLKLKVEDLEVHGGITFNHDGVWGWDYNHYMDLDLEHPLKTKFQSRPIEEVVDIIASDCQEFIRRYLI